MLEIFILDMMMSSRVVPYEKLKFGGAFFLPFMSAL
jgi:hypothetical protein